MVNLLKNKYVIKYKTNSLSFNIHMYIQNFINNENNYIYKIRNKNDFKKDIQNYDIEYIDFNSANQYKYALYFVVNKCLRIIFDIKSIDKSNKKIVICNKITLDHIENNLDCFTNIKNNSVNRINILFSKSIHFIKKYFPGIKYISCIDEATIQNTGIVSSSLYFYKYYKPFYVQRFRFTFADKEKYKKYITKIKLYKKHNKITKDLIKNFKLFCQNYKNSNIFNRNKRNIISMINKNFHNLNNISFFILLKKYKNKKISSFLHNSLQNQYLKLFIHYLNQSFDIHPTFFSTLFIKSI